jgi:hypothetical protein
MEWLDIFKILVCLAPYILVINEMINMHGQETSQLALKVFTQSKPCTPGK